jgi:DNA mismatch repair protein MutS
MGKRLLRTWLLRPSLDLAEINARLDAVEAGAKNTIAREELCRALDGVLDLERLLSRVTLETANPRDVLALAASLAKIPTIKNAVGRLASERLSTLHTSLDELADLRDRIDTTIVPEPPLTFADGGVITAGIDRDLDELRGNADAPESVLSR